METVFESEDNAAGPTVSVVVISFNTPQTLERCLASLIRQTAKEILVIDCSDRNPAEFLRERFPQVEFRHFGGQRTIPELRREGIRASTGEIVALTESWMEPCASWVDALREAHHRRPDDAVVGGPIDFPCGGETRSLLEWADYFSEYGEYVPGTADVPAGECVENVSGGNCSYKRWAIEECSDLVDQGAWEPLIHERLRRRGHPISIAAAARVCYRRSAPASDLLRQRYHHGRDHGAVHLTHKPWALRVIRGLAAPLVPWVLLGRRWRELHEKSGLHARFAAAAGWTLLLFAAWAAGEAVGACLGPARGNSRTV